MYVPDAFRVTDQDEITAFLKVNAFGQLISQVNGRLFSTHLPFMYDENKKTLLGHMARPNPQWDSLKSQEVLISFQGPHDYISPSWYASAGVPTWNYQAVHVYGRCEVIQDATALGNIVDSLTNVYESGMDKPWKPEYREVMLKGIVGLRISVTEIHGKYKLSQNRSKVDQEQVVQKLKDMGSKELPAAMAFTKKQ